MQIDLMTKVGNIGSLEEGKIKKDVQFTKRERTNKVEEITKAVMIVLGRDRSIDRNKQIDTRSYLQCHNLHWRQKTLLDPNCKERLAKHRLHLDTDQREVWWGMEGLKSKQDRCTNVGIENTIRRRQRSCQFEWDETKKAATPDQSLAAVVLNWMARRLLLLSQLNNKVTIT